MVPIINTLISSLYFKTLDGPCVTQTNNVQGNCCLGLVCHKCIPTWGQGRCYNPNGGPGPDGIDHFNETSPATRAVHVMAPLEKKPTVFKKKLSPLAVPLSTSTTTSPLPPNSVISDKLRRQNSKPDSTSVGQKIKKQD